MDAIVAENNREVQIIDASIVRVHQHGATAKRRIEINVWAVREAALPPKLTPSSTSKGGQSG